MSAAEKRAYVIADNKLALNAGWDEEILAEELKGLLAEDIGFDIGLTGFSIPEIDSLIEGLAPEEPGDPEDDADPGRGAGPLPARRHLAAWAASADLRQRPRSDDGRDASWTASGRRWSSRTRPTTCRSRATSAARARSSTASSPWPRAR